MIKTVTVNTTSEDSVIFNDARQMFLHIRNTTVQYKYINEY
jgi:hypothetical protein